LYLFFDDPKPLAALAPLLAPTAGRLNTVVGQSFFGDLFLRDPGTGEHAILFVPTLELVESWEMDERGFREQILANPEVGRSLLRPDDSAELVRRLGAPARRPGWMRQKWCFPRALSARARRSSLRRWPKDTKEWWPSSWRLPTARASAPRRGARSSRTRRSDASPPN